MTVHEQRHLAIIPEHIRVGAGDMQHDDLPLQLFDKMLFYIRPDRRIRGPDKEEPVLVNDFVNFLEGKRPGIEEFLFIDL